MIVDRTGAYATLSRHDYLPFGEELFAGVGGRTTGLGYIGDNTRQHFTGYEMDAETELNFAQARYQSSAQGRFTSVDPLGASASVASPQSFNRYSYVQNNPTNATDPSGMMMYDASMGYSDYAGMSGGGGDPGFGGFESSRSIIENGMNGFLDRISDNDGSSDTVSDQLDETEHSNDPASSGHSEERDAETTGDQQHEETGQDLADRAATGLSNHPGLLQEMQSSTASGVDVHIVACQAAKESNYAKLSQVPFAFKNGGRYLSGAIGADGEIGLLQIFPSTAGISAQALKSVGTNVRAATKYLMWIKNHFGIGTREALAVYNWGPGNFDRVDRDISKIYSGSLSYADKILDCARRLYLPSDQNRYNFVPR